MLKLITTKKMLLGYVLMAFMVFQPVNVLAQKSSKKSYSINTSSKNGKSTIHVKDNGKDFKIEYEGDFTVSDDDKDIIAISNGGFIEITKTSFGNKRRVVIESDRSGNLIRKYYVGRSEKNYNPDGKAWLAEILPEIVRTTTIAAESRVERFYKKGGANAVLSEIKKMDSDYVKSAYFRILLHHNLNTSELTSLVKTAGDEIKSDHYLSGILRENQKAFLANSQTITAYINATKSIESDHYVTGVLKEVINDSSISDNNMDRLLEISKSVKSDHYLTEILTEVMDNRDLNSQNIAKIISLSKDIQSDHYKTQVLKKVIHKNGLPNNAYSAFIETLEDVQSDHYVTEVISELFENKFDSSSSSFNSLLSLIENNVGSDHYATNIYKKLAKNNSLSEDQIISVFNSASKINSGHYLSETLIAFSTQVKRSSEKVKSAYRTAAKTISSDTYYGRAVKAID